LADRLRKARLVAGLTQEEFAEKLDVKPAAYSHWEAARNTPRKLVAVAQRIEMLTGIPATWMLGLSEPSPNPGGPGERGDKGPSLRPID
jgi:transcriptional regulator with XRE-family HTH domain